MKEKGSRAWKEQKERKKGSRVERRKEYEG